MVKSVKYVQISIFDLTTSHVICFSHFFIGGGLLTGWAKFNRDYIDSWIYADPIAWKIFTYIKWDVTHKQIVRKVKGRIVTLYPNQTVFGRSEWARKLCISESKVYRIIQLLNDTGHISIFTVKGQYSVITLREEESEPQSAQEAKQESEQQETHTTEGVQEFSEQGNGQQTDSRRTHYKKGKNEKNTINEFFESIWALYPNKRGKGKVSNTQKEKLHKIGFEQLLICIKLYKETKPDWQHFQNGSTFFNSGYIDYLGENISKDKDDKSATQAESRKEIVKAPDNFII